MLKPLRNKKLMQIIMWALISCFAIWGAGSAITSRKSYAGIVFGKKIYIQEFNQNYKAVLSRAKLTYGDNLPKFEKFLNLKQQAWDRIILIMEAKKRRIKTSNKDVVERIAALSIFQRDGVFSPNLYQYITMNFLCVTPYEFEQSVKNDINIEKLNLSVTKDTPISEEDIVTAYKNEREKADVSYLIINSSDYVEDVIVNQNEIESFYENNKENYKSSISTNVRYLAVPFESADEENKDEAKFHAEEVMLFAKKNNGIGVAAKEFNLEIKETGFFSINSNIPGIGLSYEFAVAALQLQGKEISDIIETSDSFCVMELIEKRPPQILSLEEAQEKVEDRLKMDKAKIKAKETANEIFAKIEFENSTIENITVERSLTINTEEGITRKSYLKNIGTSEDFIETTFSLEVGRYGGPVEINTGYAITRMDNIYPVKEEDLLKERDDFSKKLLDEKRSESFNTWFTKLRQKANLKENI